MGFKRTSEGRVFFKGSDYSANDELTQKERSTPPSSRDQTQLQILTLLKNLNEKLKTTQVDRRRLQAELDAYRSLVEDLESKTERSEKAYLNLEQKIKSQGSVDDERVINAEKAAQEALRELEKTRKAMLEIENRSSGSDAGVATLKSQIAENAKLSKELSERQVALEKQQREHAQRIENGMKSYGSLSQKIQQTAKVQNDMKDRLAVSAASVDDLSARLKKTENNQEALDTKITKAIEDRARFMRKIELIEETVIQTRDALHGNAAALLPNGAAALQIEGQVRAPDRDSDREIYGDQRVASFMRKPVRTQALVIVFLMVAGVLMGWMISEIQKPRVPALDDFDLTVLEQQRVPFERISEDESSAFKTENLSSQNLKVFSEDEERELLNLFESDPEALARRLNDIEPSSVSEAPQEPDVEAPKAAPDNEQPAAKAPEVTSKVSEPPVQKVAAVDPKQTDPQPEKPAAKASNKAEPVQASPKPEVEKAAPVKTEPPSQPVAKAAANDAKPNNQQPNIESDPNLPDFIKQIETKAFDGEPEAQHDLAAIYTAGHADVPQDYNRAAFWFREAAQNGVANARYNLGVLYHQGLGVQRDMGEAIKWYRSAASLNHPEAQYNLGIAYIEGIGVSYDPDRAAQYFENAADGGIMEAAYNLGLIHENGLLGQSKPDEALLWYKTAADAGSPEARAALDQLARTLGIEASDVNALVENVRNVKQSKPKPVEEVYNEYVEPKRVSDVNPKYVLVSQIQEYLIDSGLYPGPADGINGPQTKDAIRTYQSANALTVTGQASDELLRHMLASTKNYDMPGVDDVGSRER